MKLNTKRTVLVGFAFLSICAFWQMYDNLIPKILTETFHMGESVSGMIMAADNILALFLLPLFGGLSDKCTSRLGRRRPYILFGTLAAVAVMMALPILTDSFHASPDAWLYHRSWNPADRHGCLPQPRRGADARRHPKAPAFQGQRHHQPDGRPGRHHLPDYYHISVQNNRGCVRFLPAAVRHCGGHHAGRPCRHSAVRGRTQAGGGAAAL